MFPHLILSENNSSYVFVYLSVSAVTVVYIFIYIYNESYQFPVYPYHSHHCPVFKIQKTFFFNAGTFVTTAIDPNSNSHTRRYCMRRNETIQFSGYIILLQTNFSIESNVATENEDSQRIKV
ncbi:hypothetical protein BDA99DRAFT_544252 [Phascolomyces articulosus]|uniref:Uncharacterized protein n=1 Tax=Phascolomyces articulosus TaxID=60185 RepID=A0AAD5JVF9_9FUNG|nr:hypothetical protein BDA99DRAFT_544252 [Phascolomyces articulosus]